MYYVTALLFLRGFSIKQQIIYIFILFHERFSFFCETVLLFIYMVKDSLMLNTAFL